MDKDNIDVMQEILDDSVKMELLQVDKYIVGHRVYPITMAYVALLQQVKSPLIAGVPIDSIENILLDCCIFIRIQTLTVKEATKLAFGSREDLIVASLELAKDITPENIESVMEQIVSMLKDSTSTRVKPLPRDGDNPISIEGKS
jgi:hypothetical protein